MREISVTYLLLDEDEQRLEKLTEEYKKKGLDSTSEKLFGTIMRMGAGADIEQRLKFHEWKLGLRESIS